MTNTLTVDNWDTLSTDVQPQWPFRIQEQINNIRSQYREWSLSNSYAYSSTEVSSTPGLSPQYDQDSKVEDTRDWVSYLTSRLINEPSSQTSKFDMSVIYLTTFLNAKLSSMNSEDRKALTERIYSLMQYAAEEGEQINIISLSAFVMFLVNNNIDKSPLIAINSNGYIDALWKENKDRLIEIVFLPGNESRLVTFSHNFTKPDKIDRRAATLPISTIIDVIKNRKLETLIYSQNKRLRSVA